MAHVPSALLFPAPRLPRGHLLMGYDEHGRCPMLVDDRCSIYEHRPRTCRTYDCRVFPAAGLEPDDPDGPIAGRARRWRFSHEGPTDRVEHEAVQAAARFVEDRGRLASDRAPAGATGRAVLAIRLSGAFVGADDHGRPVAVDPDPEVLDRLGSAAADELGTV